MDQSAGFIPLLTTVKDPELIRQDHSKNNWEMYCLTTAVLLKLVRP